MKSLVAQKEVEAVANAARNPTLSCRKVMADLANDLQTEGIAAVTAMSNLRNLEQKIYQARYDLCYKSKYLLNTL